MKNKKFLALLLTLAMAVTMMPLSVFADEPQQTEGEAGPQILTDAPEGEATPTNSIDDETSDGEEAEPVEGTKENPYVMYYWRNRYYCDMWTDDNFDQREIWIKLETRTEAELAFEAYAYGDGNYLRSATMFDSDMKTVIFKFDYDDYRDAYETEKLQLKKQTYYFRLKFSDVPCDQGCSLGSIVEETASPEGTFEDPIIVNSDQNTTEEELEDYYADYFNLKEDTQSVYYRLDAFETDYHNFYLYVLNEVGIKSIKLMDARQNVLAEFEKYEYDENASPEDFGNYVLYNYLLEKGKRYYIEVLIDKSVEFDSLELSINRLDGNGMRENPFRLSYLPSDYSEWYYGYGQIYKNTDNEKVAWFKATIEKDSKVKAYAGADNESGESIVDKVELYLPGATSAINLEKNEYDVYCASEYVPVKKGDVVLFKYTFNDNVKAGNPIYAQLDCFGLTDEDVSLELDCDQYTWDGEEHKPGLAYIKYKDTPLVSGTDYDPEIQYSNTMNIGYNEVYVVGKGDYQGMRFLYFAINPLGTKLNSVSAGSKSMTVKWKKQDKKMSVDRITGYEIQYSTSKKFTDATTKTKVVRGYKKTNKTIKKLKSGKKYYVRIRTYYYDEYSWEQVYSKWSAAKTVVVK